MAAVPKPEVQAMSSVSTKTDLDRELDRVLATAIKNEESTRLALKYFVIPGHNGRYELFSCDGSLKGPEGERFRQLVIRVADEVGIDRGLLAVNAIAENNVSVFLASRHVESKEVGLDYWNTLRHSVLSSGIPGVGRIQAPDTGRVFRNEAGNDVPIYEFWDGPNALLAFAALLRVYDNRITAAAGPSLPKVTRFALVRYAYNAKPRGALDLARTAASGVEVLPLRGSAGPSHPLRTATVRAVQAIAVSENFFQ